MGNDAATQTSSSLTGLFRLPLRFEQSPPLLPFLSGVAVVFGRCVVKHGDLDGLVGFDFGLVLGGGCKELFHAGEFAGAAKVPEGQKGQ